MTPKLDLAGLVETHQAAIWRYLRLLGCGDALAEDLTQETFLSVLQKPFDDYNPASTGSYLRTVARNLFLKSLRRSKRQISLADAADALWQRYVVDEDPSAHIQALRLCLEKLEGRSKVVIEMRFADGVSRAEIAAALGMKENGVKTLMQRARAKLKECVERRLEDGR